MGALEGKAQETTQRAETREGGFFSLPQKRSSVQPPTGAVAGGGLIRLRARFARGWRRRNAYCRPSAVPVGGDVGGLLFVGAALLTFIIGLPAMRTFAIASVLCSLISAAVLVHWRREVTTPVTRLVS